MTTESNKDDLNSCLELSDEEYLHGDIIQIKEPKIAHQYLSTASDIESGTILKVIQNQGDQLVCTASEDNQADIVKSFPPDRIIEHPLSLSDADNMAEYKESVQQSSADQDEEGSATKPVDCSKQLKNIKSIDEYPSWLRLELSDRFPEGTWEHDKNSQRIRLAVAYKTLKGSDNKTIRTRFNDAVKEVKRDENLETGVIRNMIGVEAFAGDDFYKYRPTGKFLEILEGIESGLQ